MEVIKKHFLKNLFIKKRSFIVIASLLFFGALIPLQFADAGFVDWLIGGALDGLGGLLLSIVSSILALFLHVAVWLAALAGSFIDWVLHWNMFYTKCAGIPADTCFIDVAWGLMRDLVNMGLIVAIVVIALFTILGSQEYGIGKAFMPFIVVALLVNFSRVFVGIAVDLSNVIMQVFISAIPQLGNASAFIDATNVGGISDFSFDTTVAAGNLFKTIVLILFFTGLAFILMLYGVVFAARFGVIWLLTIMSPLAFAASIFSFPATRKVFTFWRDQLIQWSFVGVPMLFFLWIAMMFSLQIDKMRPPPDASGGEAFFAQIIPSFISLMMLVLAFMFGMKTSAVGAGMILNAGKRLGGAAVDGAKSWLQTKAIERYGGAAQTGLQRLAGSRWGGRLPIIGGAVRGAAKWGEQKIRQAERLKQAREEASQMSDGMLDSMLKSENSSTKFKALMEEKLKRGDGKDVEKLLEKGGREGRGLTPEKMAAMVRNLSLRDQESDIINAFPQYAYASRNAKSLAELDADIKSLHENKKLNLNEAKNAQYAKSRRKDKASKFENSALADKGVIAGLELNKNVDVFEDIATSSERLDGVIAGYRELYADKASQKIAEAFKKRNIKNAKKLFEEDEFIQALANTKDKVTFAWLQEIADQHGGETAQKLVQRFRKMAAENPDQLFKNNPGIIKDSFGHPAKATIFGTTPLMEAQEYFRRVEASRTKEGGDEEPPSPPTPGPRPTIPTPPYRPDFSPQQKQELFEKLISIPPEERTPLQNQDLNNLSRDLFEKAEMSGVRRQARTRGAREASAARRRTEAERRASNIRVEADTKASEERQGADYEASQRRVQEDTESSQRRTELDDAKREIEELRQLGFAGDAQQQRRMRYLENRIRELSVPPPAPPGGAAAGGRPGEPPAGGAPTPPTPPPSAPSQGGGTTAPTPQPPPAPPPEPPKPTGNPIRDIRQALSGLPSAAQQVWHRASPGSIFSRMARRSEPPHGRINPTPDMTEQQREMVRMRNAIFDDMEQLRERASKELGGFPGTQKYVREDLASLKNILGIYDPEVSAEWEDIAPLKRIREEIYNTGEIKRIQDILNEDPETRQRSERWRGQYL